MRARLAAAAVALLSAAPGAADEAAESPWAAGPARAFLAGRLETGLYAGARAAAGWGRPHWAWAGVESSARASLEFASVQGGVRAALPFLEVGAVARRVRSYEKPLLANLPEHRQGELEGGGNTYSAAEAWLSGVLPAPGGFVLWELAAVRPLDLPRDRQVFEEEWKVAIGQDGAAAARLAWLVRPWRARVLRLGPFGEAIALRGRGVGVLWRAGGALSWELGPHLSLLAVGSLPVTGPDRFGAWTAMYGTLALRWAFATGDPAPGFP